MFNVLMVLWVFISFNGCVVGSMMFLMCFNVYNVFVNGVYIFYGCV